MNLSIRVNINTAGVDFNTGELQYTNITFTFKLENRRIRVNINTAGVDFNTVGVGSYL